MVTSMSDRPVPLILDTDIGDDVDDVFALLLAVRDPAYDLRAVTIVYGQVDARARLARHMLDLLKRPDIPVAIGASATLAGPVLPGAPGNSMASADTLMPVPGSHAWDDLGAHLDRRDAVDLLIELVRTAPEPIVLAAIGPLTNVATALTRAPDIATRLRALVIMGGRLGPEAHVGEHNVNMDPEATAIVLASGAPLVFGTFEITREAVLGHEAVARLRTGDAACKSAADQLEQYLHRRDRPVTSMYDPVTMTLAIDDRYVRTIPLAVRVDVTPADRKAIFRVEADAVPNARVSAGIDADAFAHHLLDTVMPSVG